MSNAVDASGVRAFWPVMETLQQGREPSPTQWQSLFQTPGYARLQPSYVQRRFRLAYMPSKADELRIAVQKGDYESRVLLYLDRAPKERETINNFLRSFNAAKTIAVALKKSAVYLPKGAIASRPLPTLAFVIFEPDGHVDGDVVIFDALYAIDEGVEFENILAHEFHHYYKPSQLRAPDRSSRDYYFVHAVEQMQMEGIADLIDKKTYPIRADASRPWYAQEYNAAYVDSANTLREMAGALSDAAASPDQIGEDGKRFWDALKFAGHPTGFYMASILLKHLGRKALIASEADPFEFFRLYNLAARSCGAPCYVFPAAAMRVLGELDSKYAGAALIARPGRR